MDARAHLQGLVGKTIPTMTGKPNRVIALRGDKVIVATGKSPAGQEVPIAWVQAAMDTLFQRGEVVVSVETVGYRSAFIGAVLQTIPGTKVLLNPRRVMLKR